ncbi:MAG: hypothetical protein KAX26_01885 [Anaerolineae bacterium]|nr:hypothetical protein [Anaerolineae bacterium]
MRCTSVRGMVIINQAPRPHSGSEMKYRRRERMEPVEMRQLRHGCFPYVFTWRGREYRVEAVERCWSISRRGRGNRVESHCFRVRARPSSVEVCQGDTFHLFQDTRAGTWHMQRRAR